MWIPLEDGGAPWSKQTTTRSAFRRLGRVERIQPKAFRIPKPPGWFWGAQGWLVLRRLSDNLVQLANVAIRVTVAPSDDARFGEEVPWLFVFHDRKLKMELPLAGGASRLVLPDLQNLVTGDFGRLPAMTIVWRPGKIELVVASEDSKIILNGVEWAGTAGSARELFDRDELDAGAVKIVISDLSTAKVVKERQIKAALAIVPPAADRVTPRGYTREETKVLPRISSQGEPSAPIGCGSELFGVAQRPMAPGIGSEGLFISSEEETDTRTKRMRYVFGDGNPQAKAVRRQIQWQAGDVGAAQRFGALPPPVNDEASATNTRSEILFGVAALVLAVLVFGMLYSMFHHLG